MSSEEATSGNTNKTDVVTRTSSGSSVVLTSTSSREEDAGVCDWSVAIGNVDRDTSSTVGITKKSRVVDCGKTVKLKSTSSSEDVGNVRPRADELTARERTSVPGTVTSSSTVVTSKKSTIEESPLKVGAEAMSVDGWEETLTEEGSMEGGGDCNTSTDAVSLGIGIDISSPLPDSPTTDAVATGTMSGVTLGIEDKDGEMTTAVNSTMSSLTVRSRLESSPVIRGSTFKSDKTRLESMKRDSVISTSVEMSSDASMSIKDGRDVRSGSTSVTSITISSVPSTVDGDT